MSDVPEAELSEASCYFCGAPLSVDEAAMGDGACHPCFVDRSLGSLEEDDR